MPDSSDPRDEILRLFELRFGVSRASLSGLTFVECREEIWACRCVPPPGIDPVRPPGVRALRRQADGLKPTSAFLIALGDRITTSRVNLEEGALRRVLLGQRIPSPSQHADGYVALCFRGDVIGCGRLAGGSLRGLIPTGRRRELLAALATDRHG